jgi:hypothetical protein
MLSSRLTEHPLESFNPRIRQTQATVKVIRHDTYGIDNRVLELVEHGAHQEGCGCRASALVEQ